MQYKLKVDKETDDENDKLKKKNIGKIWNGFQGDGDKCDWEDSVLEVGSVLVLFCPEF
jgi:hypothetical protein